MSWRLLGYDGFLTKAIMGSSPPPSKQQIASGSIKTQHLYGGSVTNEKMHISSRPYQAIVSTTIGDGNYRDIQRAIDYVNSLGGGKVFIKNGTYMPTADITVPSNVYLEGESQKETIIDFNSGSFQVLVEGSINAGPSGTITVTENDATVTGAGSSFTTEVSIGDYVLVNDAWYEVLSITDNTYLELELQYEGETQAGLSYIVMTPKQNIYLGKFTVINSADSYAILIRYILNSSFKNLEVNSNNDNGIKFDFIADSSVEDIYAVGNQGFGMVINSSQSTYFIGLSAKMNTEYGIYISGSNTSGVVLILCNASHNGWSGFDIIAGQRVTYVACTSTGNSAAGFYITSLEYVSFTNCFAQYNGGMGFRLDTQVKRAKLLGCTSLNNGDDGIGLGNTCEKCIILGNTCLGNTNEQIDDNSVTSEVAHNILT